MRRPSVLLAARCVAAGVVGLRLVRAGAAQLSIEPLGHDIDPDVAISIVVPARDEAQRLGPLLDALRGAPGIVQVVVVDDQSTDATASVATRDGVIVVTGSARPAGWAGKTWALHQGTEAATGEWVVFLDADVRPDPDVAARLVARARRDRLDVVSVAPAATAPPLARLLHASMLATLVYRFGGPGWSPTGRELANGQCLAVEREPFRLRGGWGQVADAVTEDVALARRTAAGGGRVAMIDAAADVRVDVGSAAEVVSGWGRSIGLPGVGRGEIAVDAALLALTMPVPVVRSVLGRADALDVALLAMRIGVSAGTRRAYRPAGPSLWFAPLADGVSVVAVASAAVRRTVTWRGRRLPVPRSSPGGR